MKDDAISRQAAIDAVCIEWCGVKHQDCKHQFDIEKDDYYWCDGCETALRTLPDLPSVQLEPHWIPVSEKTHPDLPIRVQVQMNNGWIITAYYQDGEWLSVPNCENAIHDEWIEAWRELPELYRKKGEQE